MNENHPPYPLQMNQTEEEKPLDFIRTKVKQDQENGKNDGRVHGSTVQMVTYIWDVRKVFA